MKLEKYSSVQDGYLKCYLNEVGFMIEKLKYIEQFHKNMNDLETKLKVQLESMIKNV